MNTPAPWGEVVSLIVEQRTTAPFVVVPQQGPETVGGTGGAALAVTNANAQAVLFSHSATQALVFSPAGGRDGAAGETGPQGPAGPQGAPGVDATVHARRYEESGNYIYAATAPAGSAEGDAVWRITRITYSNGVQTSTGVAVDVTWTGRVGHTYS